MDVFHLVYQIRMELEDARLSNHDLSSEHDKLLDRFKIPLAASFSRVSSAALKSSPRGHVSFSTSPVIKVPSPRPLQSNGFHGTSVSQSDPTLTVPSTCAHNGPAPAVVSTDDDDLSDVDVGEELRREHNRLSKELKQSRAAEQSLRLSLEREREERRKEVEDVLEEKHKADGIHAEMRTIIWELLREHLKHLNEEVDRLNAAGLVESGRSGADENVSGINGTTSSTTVIQSDKRTKHKYVSFALKSDDVTDVSSLTNLIEQISITTSCLKQMNVNFCSELSRSRETTARMQCDQEKLKSYEEEIELLKVELKCNQQLKDLPTPKPQLQQQQKQQQLQQQQQQQQYHQQQQQRQQHQHQELAVSDPDKNNNQRTFDRSLLVNNSDIDWTEEDEMWLHEAVNWNAAQREFGGKRVVTSNRNSDGDRHEKKESRKKNEDQRQEKTDNILAGLNGWVELKNGEIGGGKNGKLEWGDWNCPSGRGEANGWPLSWEKNNVCWRNSCDSGSSNEVDDWKTGNGGEMLKDNLLRLKLERAEYRAILAEQCAEQTKKVLNEKLVQIADLQSRCAEHRKC